MKTVDFKHDNLALCTDLLGTMQSSYQLIQSVSRLIGDKFVISGCAENGVTILPGWVCIDGEIMETDGGGYPDRCKVVESTQTVNIQDGSYTVATKKLIFGREGDFRWTDVKRLGSLEQTIANMHNIQNDLKGEISGIDRRVGVLEEDESYSPKIEMAYAEDLTVKYSTMRRVGKMTFLQCHFTAQIPGAIHLGQIGVEGNTLSLGVALPYTSIGDKVMIDCGDIIYADIIERFPLRLFIPPLSHNVETRTFTINTVI